MSVSVTVIIPTYNRAADLRRALTSLRAQTENNWEAIVVDNHSTDDTRQVVESFRDARIRMIDVHNHGIVSLSRNVGIRAATTEYIAFLDSDDWWAPSKLQESLRRLEAGADVVYHDLYIVKSANQSRFLRRARTRALSVPVFDDLLRNGNGLAASSVVTRRALLDKIGGFLEESEWIGSEDYETWLRMSSITDRFERLETPLGFYWFGGGNLSTPDRLLMNLAAFRRKYIESEGARLREPPWWYYYLLGRSHYSNGNYPVVAGQMRLAMATDMPLQLKAKAVCWSLMAAVRGLFARR